MLFVVGNVEIVGECYKAPDRVWSGCKWLCGDRPLAQQGKVGRGAEIAQRGEGVVVSIIGDKGGGQGD
jgi:hypothetical protein